jgi:hypothetical protein
MSESVTNANAVMRKLYADGVIELDYKKSKTLSLLKKGKGTMTSTPFGEVFAVPVKHGNPQAGAADYAEAYGQAPNENTRYAQWQISPRTIWHFADVEGDFIRRSSGVGSVVNAMTSSIENAKAAFQRILENQLFKGGFGDLFQLSPTAAVASATGVALAQKWMVRNVEKGMSVVFSASESGHVLKGTTAVKVVGRSSSAGTLDFSAAPNQAGTLAAVSDFGFRKGDRQNSATPARLVWDGFKAWLPTTAPGATPFNGVVRNVDDRLGGCRLDATLSGSPEEAFMDAEAQVDAEGGKLSHVVMGRETFNKLAKSMQNHVEYAEITSDIGIGIPGFTLKGSDAVFYWDAACEEGIAYGFNIEEVELLYAGGDLIKLEQTDGLTFREVAGTDNWRARILTCSNFTMPAPGHAICIFNL